MLAAPHIIPLTNMAMTGVSFLQLIWEIFINSLSRFSLHRGGNHCGAVHHYSAGSTGNGKDSLTSPPDRFYMFSETADGKVFNFLHSFLLHLLQLCQILRADSWHSGDIYKYLFKIGTYIFFTSILLLTIIFPYFLCNSKLIIFYLIKI